MNGASGSASLGPRDLRPPHIWWLRAIVALLGALQVWIYRGEMNNDALFYTDIARTYAGGDWSAAVNGFWSPLYSWLTAPVFVLFDPAPRNEFAVLHALIFPLFLLTLAAFDFFLRELFRTLERLDATASRVFGLSWWAAGYALFAYSTLVMVNLGRIGPDILVAAAMYAASALLLRLARADRFPAALALGLGVTLGLGYLAKAVLFPISLVILASAFLLVMRRPRAWLGLAFAALAFAIVAGPWVAALTTSRDRFTFGDAGRLNYAWKVNNVPISHWQGDSLHGTPVHPTRKLSEGPVVYEFAAPVRGTYPVWHDPSYWFEGIQPRVILRQQVRRIATSAGDLLSSLWLHPLMLGVLVVGFFAGSAGFTSAVRRTWYLLVPASAGVAAYVLVLISDRYIAPFVLIGSLALMGGMAAHAIRAGRLPPQAAHSVPRALAVIFGVLVLNQLWFADRQIPPVDHFRNAVRIAGLGVPPGSRIGMIGQSPNAYWAHLARDTIVAEIVPEQSTWFWALDRQEQSRLLALFAGAGAVAVVAEGIPHWADRTGWVEVEDSAYWLHLLSPLSGRQSPD